MKDELRVQRTWDELGYKIRAMNNRVWVRTFPTPQMTESGLLHLAPRQSSFYGERMASKMYVTATVLALTDHSKIAEIGVGDELLFTRLEFARHCFMDDQSLVGWIRLEHIMALVEDSAIDRNHRRFLSTVVTKSAGGREIA
jgi:hypothetical protein